MTFDDREHCKTCFWRDEKDCRRFPPTAFPTPSVNPLTGRPEVTILGLFPPVPESGWCGEWKAKVVA